MAIYWVDPYLESSGGGIHGTTSSGGGTYASPWKLTNLLRNGDSKLSSINSGDELRFKGLPFDDFFGSSQAFIDSQEGADGRPNTYYWRHPDVEGQFMYMKKRHTGERFYKSQNNDNMSEYLMFSSAHNTWHERFPAPDKAFGVRVMPASKSISDTAIHTANSNSSYRYWLYKDSFATKSAGGLTVTAGWVSETSQTGGMTIIHMNNDRQQNCNNYWGGNTASHTGYINWDCRDTLIISAAERYSHQYIYGNDIKLEAFKGGSYSPGYTTECNAYGDIDIGHFGAGGYNRIRTFAYAYNGKPTGYDESKHTFNVNLDRFTGGYHNQDFYCYYPHSSHISSYSDSTTRTINFTLNKTAGHGSWRLYNNQSSYPGNLHITFPDGYNHVKNAAYPGHVLYNFKTSTQTVTTNIGTPDPNVPMFSTNSNRNADVNENSGYAGLGAPPPSNSTLGSSVNHNNNYVLQSDVNNIFAGALASTPYRSIMTELELADSSLEDMVGNPLSFSDSPGSMSNLKVTVLTNNKDHRPLTLMSPGNYNKGPSIAQFNSPVNNNKLVWHFFNNNNALEYGDNYALQIPDYSTNDLKLNWDVTHPDGMDISCIVSIVYVKNQPRNSASNQYPINSANRFHFTTPTTSTSTTKVFSETITSTDMIAANPKYMWAWVSITKNDNMVGNVVFNQLDLTQIT